METVMSGRNARLFRRTIDPKDLARQWLALNHRQRGAWRPALRRAEFDPARFTRIAGGA